MDHDRAGPPATMISRRRALALAAGAVPAFSLLGARAAGAPESPAGARTRVLRLAHFTDMHIQPELRAGEGVRAALAHAADLADRPSLIVTGGDLVFDTFDQGAARTGELWDLFTKTFRDHWPGRVEHTLGNHDIWGWNKPRSKTTGDEPLWGKARALDALGMPGRYYASTHANWRIVHLDSIQSEGNGYIARIDDEQLAWLEAQLRDAAGASHHVLVVSHAPILSICSMLGDGRTQENKHVLSGAEMHIDARKLHTLLAGAGCVRACLSGHIHRIDRVLVDSVTYICDGAVCGAWWKGRKDRCDEGYGVVDLHSDGTFDHAYHTYAWNADQG